MWVITNPELGWDCVVALLSEEPTPELYALLEKKELVVHYQEPETAAHFAKQISS